MKFVPTLLILSLRFSLESMNRIGVRRTDSPQHRTSYFMSALPSRMRCMLVLVLLVAGVAPAFGVVPDVTSVVTCASTSLFIGTSTTCTWAPQSEASSISVAASTGVLDTYRSSPVANYSYPIGTTTALSPSSGTSSIFTFNITAGLRTGTYVVQILDPASVNGAVDSRNVLGSVQVVVSSTQYISMLNYAENQNFAWTISLPARFSGGYIQIWFTSFQTEPSDACNSDAVSIYAGSVVTPLSVPLYKVCEGATNVDTAIWQYHDNNGNFYNIDNVFNFQMQTVTVTFASDVSNNFAGFVLAYDFTLDPNFVEIPDNVTSSGPTFKYQNYTADNGGSITLVNYKNQFTGRYLITSQMPCAVITVYFARIDIEDTILCTNDFLSIYDGVDETASKLAVLCGGSASGDATTSYHDSFGQVYSLGRSSSFKSSGPNMYITFSSNDVVTATGFVILFSAAAPIITTGSAYLPGMAPGASYLTQVRGDPIMAGYISFASSLFQSAISLPDPTITYTITGPGGVALSQDGLSFTQMSVVGTFPIALPTSTSFTLYNMTVTASNTCNYSTSKIWTISTFPLMQPDATSSFSCANRTIWISGTKVPPIVCTFLARNQNNVIATLPSYITPMLVNNADGSVSAGALSSVVSTGSALTRTSSTFQFNYLPEPSGGIATITLGISGIPNWNISVYVNPDATSRILCSPQVLLPGGTTACTIETRSQQAPVKTHVPFLLNGQLVPYASPLAPDPTAVVFTSFLPDFGSLFKFNITVGTPLNTPSCDYPICVSSTNCFNLTVVGTPTADTYVMCDQSLISPGSKILCSVYPQDANGKICAASSSFAIPGTNIQFLQQSGSKLDFWLTLSAVTNTFLADGYKPSLLIPEMTTYIDNMPYMLRGWSEELEATALENKHRLALRKLEPIMHESQLQQHHVQVRAAQEYFAELETARRQEAARLVASGLQVNPDSYMRLRAVQTSNKNVLRAVGSTLVVPLTVNNNSATNSTLNTIPAPDSTSYLTCPTSAPLGSLVYCIIVAQIGGVEAEVLASAFSVVVTQGIGKPSAVSIWRSSVRSPDANSSRFQFAVQLTRQTTSVTVSDGVSAVPATIYATSDPDSGRLINCPSPIVLAVSTSITCTFMALNSGVQVQTFPSRFSIGLTSAVDANNRPTGSVSSITPKATASNTNTSSTSYQFQFTYTAPALSVTASLSFTVYYPNNGGPMITVPLSVVVTDVPDSTSSLDCGGGSGSVGTSYAPIICVVFPRKNNMLINSLASAFSPSVVSGPANIYSALTPSAGSPLVFRMSFQQSYQSAVITDGVSASAYTAQSTSPGQLITWTTTDALPSNLILPALGRQVGANLLSTENIVVPPTGSRITLQNKYSSTTCASYISYCLAVSENGDVVSWGVPNPAALGRPLTDMYGSSLQIYGNTIQGELELLIVTEVSVIDTVDAVPWSLALTTEGNIFMWGVPSRSPTLFPSNPVVAALPFLLKGVSNVKKMSKRGPFVLFADAAGVLYTMGVNTAVYPISRGGAANLPLPVQFAAGGPSTAADMAALAPWTSLFVGPNYAIAISRNLRWFTWGIGLQNTMLRSGNLAQEVDYFAAGMPAFFNNPRELILKVEGCSNALLILSSAGMVYSVTLDYSISGGFTVRNPFEVVSSNAMVNAATLNGIDQLFFTDIAGGDSTLVQLATDSGGSVWQWSALPNSISPYLKAQQVTLPQGSVCWSLSSAQAQTCGVISPVVSINPTFPSAPCGVSSLNCSSLTTALKQFPLVGTTFVFQPGTHVITGATSTSADLRLTSSSGASMTTIDCQGSVCLTLSGNGIILDGLTLQNGMSSSYGGAFRVAFGQQFNVRNSVIQQCNATSGGGAIYVEGQLLVVNSSILACSTSGTGGAIMASMSTSTRIVKAQVSLTQSIISGCSASRGGAVFGLSTVLNTYSTNMANNAAIIRGGALDAQLVDWTATGSSMNNNTAPLGGAVYATDCVFRISANTKFVNNTALSAGGAFYLSFVDVSFDSSSFTSNYVSDAQVGTGGAAYVMGNTPFSINNCVFSNNGCAATGGALQFIFSAPIITGCQLTQNYAVEGGAIYLGLQASLSMSNTSLNSNRASLYGAGISAHQCSPVSVFGGARFFNNTALVSGGAIQVFGNTNVSFEATTFLQNNAPAGGAIYWDKKQPTWSYSCVFTANVAQQGPNWASEPKSIAWTNPLVPAGWQFNSAYQVEYSLQASLLDFYNQVVAVDSSTFLSASSSQLGVSLGGQTSDQLVKGNLTLSSIIVILKPNMVATVLLSGFFQGIGTYFSPALSVPLRQCRPGEYFNSVDRCLPCSMGEFSNIYGATTCTSCSPGSFANTTGLSVCPLCPLGFAAPASGSLGCGACTLGRYASAPGLASCPSCPAGRASTVPGSSECTICPIGWEAQSTGQTTCDQCVPGRYSDRNGTVACKNCLGGWSSTNAAQTSCSGCIAGQFAQVGSQNCLDCPSTAFSARAHSDTCIPCWDYSEATPSKTWCQCGVGWYEFPNPGAMTFYNQTNPAIVSALTGIDATPYQVNGVYQLPSCMTCPIGADCAAIGVRIATVTALPGYWPEVRNTNTKFIKCLSGNCVGGTSVCAANYTGNLCTECPNGLGRSGTFDCAVCPDPTMNKLLMSIGVFLQIGINTFLIWSTVTADKSPTHSVLIKILTSCAQFNALATRFQFQFPSFVTAIFSSQQGAASVGQAFTSFDCLFGNESNPAPVYINLLMYFFIVPLCFILPYGVIMKLKQRAYERRGETDEKRREIDEEYRNMYITAVIISVFLQHPTISQVTLNMFNCMQLGISTTDLYLVPDLRQSCEESNYLYWRGFLAVPMLLFYVFGIPITAGLLMRQHSHELDAPHVRARYQFLYGGYLQNRYFWELVIMVRKMAMIFVVVFFSFSVNIQVLVAIFVILVFTVANFIFRPYEVVILDKFESLSLLTSFVTFYCGLFLFVQDLTSTDRMLLSVAIVASNVAFFLYGGISVYLLMRAQNSLEDALDKVGISANAKFDDMDIETLKLLPHHLLPKPQQELLAKHGGDPMAVMRAVKAKMSMLEQAEVLRKAKEEKDRLVEEQRREYAMMMGLEYVPPEKPKQFDSDGNEIKEDVMEGVELERRLGDIELDMELEEDENRQAKLQGRRPTAPIFVPTVVENDGRTKQAGSSLRNMFARGSQTLSVASESTSAGDVELTIQDQHRRTHPRNVPVDATRCFLQFDDLDEQMLATDAQGFSELLFGDLEASIDVHASRFRLGGCTALESGSVELEIFILPPSQQILSWQAGASKSADSIGHALAHAVAAHNKVLYQPDRITSLLRCITDEESVVVEPYSTQAPHVLNAVVADRAASSLNRAGMAPTLVGAAPSLARSMTYNLSSSDVSSTTTPSGNAKHQRNASDGLRARQAQAAAKKH